MKPKIYRSISSHGIALVECLVYVGVWMTILSVGLSLYLKLLGFHRDVERNSGDIIRTLKAGEIWRADVRSASGPIQATRTDAGFELTIPTDEGSVQYLFDRVHLWRQPAGESTPRPWLYNVSQCEFVKESRDPVTAWRWEVQLRTIKKTVRIQPQFSFLAVQP